MPCTSSHKNRSLANLTHLSLSFLEPQHLTKLLQMPPPSSPAPPSPGSRPGTPADNNNAIPDSASHEPDLPLTMASSVILSALPRDATTAGSEGRTEVRIVLAVDLQDRVAGLASLRWSEGWPQPMDEGGIAPLLQALQDAVHVSWGQRNNPNLHLGALPFQDRCRTHKRSRSRWLMAIRSPSLDAVDIDPPCR